MRTNKHISPIVFLDSCCFPGSSEQCDPCKIFMATDILPEGFTPSSGDIPDVSPSLTCIPTCKQLPLS